MVRQGPLVTGRQVAEEEQGPGAVLLRDQPHLHLLPLFRKSGALPSGL